MTLRWLAMTGFGSGCAPVASGTLASSGALAIALVVWAIDQASGTSPIVLSIALGVLTLLAGAGCVRWGPWAIAHFPAKAHKTGDPSEVVIDEYAGQWVALVALPMATLHQTLAVMAVQFFLFRLFDVIKPPPARQLERLPAGWGILADDLAAGVYANLVGQIIFRVAVA